jgi:phage shock protein A
MSFLKRLFKIGQAHANQAVDALEDPAVMLDQAIRDGEQELRENLQRLQQLLAHVKQQGGQAAAEGLKQTEWEGKAEQALGAGNEELATRALERAAEHESNAATFQQQHDSLNAEYKKLKAAVSAQSDNLESTKRDKQVILARLQAAGVKKDINEAKANIGNNKDGASKLIARMREKANQTVAEADAAEEMANSAGDSLEKDFASLNAPNTAVADKLAAMKAKMSQ